MMGSHRNVDDDLNEYRVFKCLATLAQMSIVKLIEM